MITLPDFGKTFDYENNFYLSCDSTRIRKVLAQYELYKMTKGVPGAIVEFGVLKGCSFVRFAAFRQLFAEESKPLIGFDSFGPFPETAFEPDMKLRQAHIDECGDESIGREQLLEVLEKKGGGNHVDLIEGDITRTLPAYLDAHPGLTPSLVNLDVDIYEPSKVVLELMYPRLAPGGILVLDDYGTFPGETKAADDYFGAMGVRIESLDFTPSPRFVRKR